MQGREPCHLMGLVGGVAQDVCIADKKYPDSCPSQYDTDRDNPLQAFWRELCILQLLVLLAHHLVQDETCLTDL